MPEEQIRQLREQIDQVNRQLHDIGLSLKGSESLDIAGVFKRLQDVEACTNRCEKLINEFKDEIEDEFKVEFKLLHEQIRHITDQIRNEHDNKINLILHKVEQNSTTITAALMEMQVYRAIFGIFKSKNFWRLAGIAFGSIVFSKSYYWIVERLVELWNTLIK